MALAKTESVANKPKRLSNVEAAALPLVGVSAWRALVENIGLSNGQQILIHGGAGGIGSIAIQLAKNLGAFVATTVNTIYYVTSRVLLSYHWSDYIDRRWYVQYRKCHHRLITSNYYL
jgi:NADPH:quinone reductase-like Zn-dependent oxidoreductase